MRIQREDLTSSFAVITRITIRGRPVVCSRFLMRTAWFLSDILFIAGHLEASLIKMCSFVSVVTFFPSFFVFHHVSGQQTKLILVCVHRTSSCATWATGVRTLKTSLIGRRCSIVKCDPSLIVLGLFGTRIQV